MKSFELFVTCPKGLEPLLLEELSQLGAHSCKETVLGVYCSANLDTIYQVCLWSRFANRVYLKLKKNRVFSTKDCYALAKSINWAKTLRPQATIAVDFNGKSDFIRNTMFGGQVIKDAVVDQIVESKLERPQVNPKSPDCLIYAHLHQGELSIYYDLSGHSLHQRGYRKEAGAAPLKENVAAALVARSKWTKTPHLPLIDPCCGSGTVLIEAMMIATNKAPGLDRGDYGFKNWQGHDDKIWSETMRDAQEKHREGKKNTPVVVGYDIDMAVLDIARRNIAAAGFSDLIRVEKRPLQHFVVPKECGDLKGFIVTNPPYGERLSENSLLFSLYEDLGKAIDTSGFSAAVLTSDPSLARATGLRSHKQYSVFNGKIPCKIYLFNAT